MGRHAQGGSTGKQSLTGWRRRRRRRMAAVAAAAVAAVPATGAAAWPCRCVSRLRAATAQQPRAGKSRKARPCVRALLARTGLVGDAGVRSGTTGCGDWPIDGARSQITRGWHAVRQSGGSGGAAAAQGALHVPSCLSEFSQFSCISCCCGVVGKLLLSVGSKVQQRSWQSEGAHQASCGDDRESERELQKRGKPAGCAGADGRRRRGGG